MKTKLIFAGMLTAVLAAWTGNAQNLEEPAIKILPAIEEGKLKLLYARDAQHAVEVKFIGENGLLQSDRIKAGTFQNGFIKKYDVSRIKEKNFWVEVSSNNLKVRYKVVAKDQKTFVPYLEQTTYSHPMVAAIN